MKNVILITVDSLRADCLDKAPNIANFAKEGYLLNNAYATGPVSSQSFISILASVYPLDFEALKKINKPKALLGQAFKDNGFTTASFHSINYLNDYLEFDWDFSNQIASNKKQEKKILKKIFWAFEKFFLDIFPSLVFGARYLLHRAGFITIKPRLEAAKLNLQVKDFVKKQKEPFFLWVHYMDVHEPYLPYESHFKDRKLSYDELAGYYLNKTKNKNFLKRHIKKARELYEDGIKYVDKELGDLFDFFKKNNIWDESIVVFASDHGDAFLEHGRAGHYDGLYNELLRVPLIIKDPGRIPKIINRKVSLIDLAPTICDLAGVGKPSSFKGHSLFESEKEFIFHQTARNSEKTGRDSFTEINDIKQCKLACQNSSFKYMLDFNTKKEELYDLSGDPAEKNNIAGEKKEIIAQMRKIINERLFSTIQ
jgi:arylsulfatase A-like enzyme